MSKLPNEEKFIDLSDYGRPLGRCIAALFKDTPVGAKSITLLFFSVGFLAIYYITQEKYLLAAILLPIKSAIDAADGEIARLQNRPSYVGRYMDSLCDIIINIGLFIAIGLKTNTSILMIVITIIAFQLQGTIFNYYYCIKRKQAGGDTTSRVFEYTMPTPYPWDHQPTLWVFHKLYLAMYAWQDWLIQLCDTKAIHTPINKPFLTAMSTLGLGFQLLVISTLLATNNITLIYPVFLYGFSAYALLLILYRKRCYFRFHKA